MIAWEQMLQISRLGLAAASRLRVTGSSSGCFDLGQRGKYLPANRQPMRLCTSLTALSLGILAHVVPLLPKLLYGTVEKNTFSSLGLLLVFIGLPNIRTIFAGNKMCASSTEGRKPLQVNHTYHQQTLNGQVIQAQMSRNR